MFDFSKNLEFFRKSACVFFKDLDSRVFARRALCVFVVIFVTPICIAETERTRRH